MRVLFILTACCGLLPFATYADAPAVAVVLGPEAPELERFAADELSTQFQQLFDAEVSIVESQPADAKNVILIGSPATNPAIGADHWPSELSDQGHLIKSVPESAGAPEQLIVGGGSPVATLWAVYELGHHFGMRYLLHGDFAPIDKPEFSLSKLDIALEPNLKIRAWRTIDAGAASQESWGLADHEKLIGQLAKLKFTHVTMVIHPWQPFYDVEGGGSPKIEGTLWLGREFPVDGDTAGRSVFDGAELFQNPDFSDTTSDAERVVAGGKLTTGIMESAGRFGMSASFATVETEESTGLVIISLAQPNGGLLPQFSTSKLPEVLSDIRDGESQKGFAVKCWIPGNLNADVYYLSRAAFDAELTPAQTLDSLVAPICGEGVAERLATGFEAIEKVSALIAENDPEFASPDPKMFMEHFETGEPTPEWWAEANKLYGTAVNEMYRANTRARGGARPFILYHAKYFFFALHYMTAIEHASLAGIARKEKDSAAWAENLELAVESMHNALSIYSEVARDNSDRGVIAVLNNYAYRPLIEALDEAPLE